MRNDLYTKLAKGDHRKQGNNLDVTSLFSVDVSYSYRTQDVVLLSRIFVVSLFNSLAFALGSLCPRGYRDRNGKRYPSKGKL